MRHNVNLGDPRRGAALVIAIAIMTILLAIALTFYAVTRVEVKTATNVVNAVRVEFLADAAVAIAVSTLNQDLLDHPRATSLDHPWRSVFSGAAFAGKPWALRNGRSLIDGGVPQIDVNNLPYVDVDNDGLPDERLYIGPVTRNWLFIPRAEGAPVLYDNVTLYRWDAASRGFIPTNPNENRYFNNALPGTYPFVTSKFYGQAAFPNDLPVFPIPENDNPNLNASDPSFGDGLQYAAEQVDRFADVDNDENGLKDAMWVPLPIDLFFRDDGLDNDLDGMIDEQQDDQSDNDRDGSSDGDDTDNDGRADMSLDVDEAIEGAPFVYYGGFDGIDNDGDGLVDIDDAPGATPADPALENTTYEYDPNYDPITEFYNVGGGTDAPTNLGFFLAAPLPGITLKVDLNANGIIGDAGDMVYPLDDSGNPILDGNNNNIIVPAEITLPLTLQVRLRLPNGDSTILNFTEENVDSIDNDYDLLINEYYTYAFLGPPAPAVDPTYLYKGPIDQDWYHVNNWLGIDENGNNVLDIGEPDFQDIYAAAIALMYNDINLTRLGTTMDDDTLNADWKTLYTDPLTAMKSIPVNTDLLPFLRYRLHVTHTGEPVCDLVGRAAILIKDEQSKINPNAAGGHAYREQFASSLSPRGLDGAIFRAMDEGATPYEYETRVIPDTGLALSTRMWGYLNGAPEGITFPADSAEQTTPSGAQLWLNYGDSPGGIQPTAVSYGDYFSDVSFPGYGRVDDNANALVLGLNGVNDDGDFDIDTAWFDSVGFNTPLRDEGLRLPRISTVAADVLTGGLGLDQPTLEDYYGRGAIIGTGGFQPAVETVPIFTEVASEVAGDFVPYFLRLGLLEGIDEPGELQLGRPLRDLLAESDGVNNDADNNDVTDEFGELSDRALRTIDDLGGVSDVGSDTLFHFSQILSPYAADRNVRLFDTANGIKTLAKIDFNRATPQQIAAEMILSGNLRTITDPQFTARAQDPNSPDYVEGPIFKESYNTLPADGFVVASTQAAAMLFAEGLKRPDVGVRAPLSQDHAGVDINFDFTPDGGEQAGLLYGFDLAAGVLAPATTQELGNRIPEDPVLAALMAAVDIVDNRDPDHARTTLTTENINIIERPAEQAAALAEADNGVPNPYEGVYHYPASTDLGPRERIPSDDLVHLESIEEYAETQLESDDAPLLEFADRWWSRFVTNDLTEDGSTLPEERRISYTVTGNEAVRINEIMVRPVRRVEAEATPDIHNFLPSGVFSPYDAIYDPTPFATELIEPGGPVEVRYAAELPEFHMKRRETTQAIRDLYPPLYTSIYGLSLPYDENTDFVSLWQVQQNDLTQPAVGLGEGTYVGTRAVWTGGSSNGGGNPPERLGSAPATSGHPGLNIPNAMEYLFVASPGLPAGRYYMTINVARETSAITFDEEDILYSIKYVPVTIDPGTGEILTSGNTVSGGSVGTTGNTIIDDLTFIAATRYPVDLAGFPLGYGSGNPWTSNVPISIGGSGNADDAVNYLSQAWHPLEYIANGADERAGWVFLDGSKPVAPTGSGDIDVLLSTYFEQGVGSVGGNEYLRAQGPILDAANNPKFTHTVVIPPPPTRNDLLTGLPPNEDGSLPPGEVMYALCVAFMIDPAYDLNAGSPQFEINFFDFSQEPDHEYVELVNTSDEPVDISGWTVEVGFPRVSGAADDPNAVQLRIPPARISPTQYAPTVIAPGGMVLLTPNKFDLCHDANVPATGTSGFLQNGIGCAQGLLGAGGFPEEEPFAHVTTPPIPDINRLWDVFDPGPLFDPTGSEFSRYDMLVENNPFDMVVTSNAVQYDDYVDRNGNGIDDLEVLRLGDEPITVPGGAGLGPAVVNASATRENVPALADAIYNTTTSESANFAGPNRPWDRIVEVAVSVPEFTSTNVDDIAALVLRGGIFPNYPEYDNIDNDGDGPYDRIDGAFDRGILAKDMVDNDFDGRIDEDNEGIDEGRNMLLGFVSVAGALPGFFQPGVMPFAFYAAGGTPYVTELVVNGGDGIPVVDETAGTLYPNVSLANFTYSGSTSEAAYIGSDLDPPEWKNFVQRRWYPGDNVFVTLYAGTPQSGLVADRVTYTQYDVENRTIDDLKPCPYPVRLNDLFPSMWLPNQMGLDFYKSLERKHPLYKGDRFGTTNRWQATDGNYDDWAESVLPWERPVVLGAWPYAPSLLTGDYTYYRFAPNAALASDEVNRNRLIYGTALNGTPLRMNAATRAIENPIVPNWNVDGIDTTAQNALFTQLTQYLVPLRNEDAEVVNNATWGARHAEQRDRPYASPGDLLNVPSMHFEHVMLNAAALNSFYDAGRYLLPMTPVNMSHPNDDLSGFDPQAVSLRSALLGQAVKDSTQDAVLAAAIDTTAFDPIILSVGQAKFTPIRPWKYENPPLPDDYGSVDQLYEWRGNALSGFNLPKAWSPVYLFTNGEAGARFVHPRPLLYGTASGPVDDDQVVDVPQVAGLINLSFLFNFEGLPSDPGGFVSRLADRWPLEKRIVAYVADNTPLTGVTDASSVPELHAEAVFEWDAEDGLENGVYTAYIGTFIPGLREAFARAEEASLSVASLPTAAPEPSWLGREFLDPLITEESGTTPEDDDLYIGALLPDPVASSTPISQESETMAMEIEFFTDRQRAGGIMDEKTNRVDSGIENTPTGLENPADWSGIVRAPRSDGYIFYGEAGLGTWRAIPVEVRDNYLALRVRNLSPPGRGNMITHVVLAPRKSTRGRVNINTAEAEAITFGGRTELFSALVGLPGIINGAVDINGRIGQIGYNEDVAMPTPVFVEPNATSWPPPDNEYLANRGFAGDVPVPPLVAEATNQQILDAAPLRTAALQLMALIMDGRPEHPDGRYYESTSELARDSSVYTSGRPGDWTELDDRAAVYPLSNTANAEQRFLETQERFRRMANMVTTRSDLFEIIATVQSGYGLDLDGDGFINYRSDEEFVATAESKVRSVYERRTPRPVPQPAGNE